MLEPGVACHRLDAATVAGERRALAGAADHCATVTKFRVVTVLVRVDQFCHLAATSTFKRDRANEDRSPAIILQPVSENSEAGVPAYAIKLIDLIERLAVSVKADVAKLRRPEPEAFQTARGRVAQPLLCLANPGERLIVLVVGIRVFAVAGS